MNPSELLNEVASRAGVSRADAGAVLDALADIAREYSRTGTSFSLADFGSSGESALDVVTSGAAAGSSRRPAYADSGAPLLGTAPYVPTSREMEDLIAAAAAHPLGIDFLLNGQIGAVAITFGTHVFTVEAARQRLSEGRASVTGQDHGC